MGKKLLMATYVLLVICANIIAQTDSLFLTEVMFYPSASNSEFIELYNAYEDKYLNLSGYQFIYENSSADRIIPAGEDSLLAPGKFVVIFEGDYDPDSGLYAGILPDDILVLKIDNNSFGSTGMANMADRTINIVNSEGDTLCSYIYSANNSPGYSDEKILTSKNNSVENWANSTIFNGTPGFINSASPLDNDLHLKNTRTLPEFLYAKKEFTISAVVSNKGLEMADDYIIKLYEDRNNDSTGSEDEFLFRTTGPALNLNDSVSVIFENLVSDTAGIINYIITVDFPKDEYLLNNCCYFTVKVKNPPAEFFDIVINEIMYQPEGDEPEWIEVFNRSDKIINLENWKVGDAISSSEINAGEQLLYPGEFLVIADENNLDQFYDILSKIIMVKLPSLNNTGDEVKLISPESSVIDSVSYVGISQDAGKSLERINTEISGAVDNWAVCIGNNHATPGLKNSVSQKDYDPAIMVGRTFPLNPSIGQTIVFEAEVTNYGLSVVNYKIELYEDINSDDEPDEKLEVSNQLLLLPKESLTYRFNYTETLEDREYRFIFRLNCENDEFEDNNEYSLIIYPAVEKHSIVINEIMYQPEGDEPEWIELFNNSVSPVNLDSWNICDAASCSEINSDLTINPGDYLVISDEETIDSFYDLSGTPFILNIPSLNNNGDEIMIKDSTGNVIDSIKYTGQSASTGRSLERISVENDSFLVCIAADKATPGNINSVSKKDIDGCILSFSTIPSNPVLGNELRFNAEIKNNGTQPFKCRISLWFDENMDSTAEKMIEQYESEVILPDSIYIHNFSSSYQALENSPNFIVKLDVENDRFPDDNERLLSINPGFEYNTVVINEIMINPEQDKPEWIELFNRSNYVIDLTNWSIGDNSTKVKILNPDLKTVNPGEYQVIVSSNDTSGSFSYPGAKLIYSTFPALNNESDAVVVFDSEGGVIDSIQYEFKTKKGFSLERISPEITGLDLTNWFPSVCKQGSTPGYENSVSELDQSKEYSLVINEVLFDCDQEHTEFVEFYNPGEEPVDAAFLFCDMNGHNSRLSDYSNIINKGEFFVIAADSGILDKLPLESCKYSIQNFSLSNSGGNVAVKDYKSNLIDTVRYDPSMHNSLYSFTENVSLEKINSVISGLQNENWTSSVSSLGATPGSRNSVYINRKVSTSSVSITPNPFSPDNDGFEDFTLIDYNLNSTVSFLRVRLYDTKGRLVRSLTENQPAASSGTIIFNGLDDNNSPLRVGIYILLFEAFDQNRNAVSAFKEALVIARKF